MRSSLRDRLGPRVRYRAIERVSTGSPMALSFTRTVANPDTPEAARSLARRHMSMAEAHRLMTDLVKLELGATLVAEVPFVDDFDVLRSELAACGIAATAASPGAS